MDQPLRPRRRLRDLTLTTGRRSASTVIRAVILGLAAMTAVAFAVEDHQVCHSWDECDEGDFEAPHTLFDDLGPAPLAILAAIVILQIVAIRRRMLAGILTALGSLVAATVAFGLTAFVHLLSSVRGQDGAAGGALFLMALALAQAILEPLLARAERARLERADPVFPRAAVVER